MPPPPQRVRQASGASITGLFVGRRRPGAHTDARSLQTLDGYVREVIALVENLPAGSEDGLVLDYEFHTGDAALDDLIAEARHARHQAEGGNGARPS